MKDSPSFALCNVLHKLIAEVLSSWLIQSLLRIISLMRSTFILGRLTTDNVLVFKVIHHLKNKGRGKFRAVAMKVDISKAYNRVDWGCPRSMLTKFGFDAHWKRWMMLCVTSVKYTIALSGALLGPILPYRGLRQDDSLLLSLSIPCVEDLSFLLRQAEGRGDLHGISVCQDAPPISHLHFAYGNVFFFRLWNLNVEKCNKVFQPINQPQANAMVVSRVLSYWRSQKGSSILT